MTAEEIRVLEIEVAKALGYRVEAYNIAHSLWTMVSPIGAYWINPESIKSTPERVWEMVTPRFITDPKATAEVKREIRRRGWGWDQWGRIDSVGVTIYLLPYEEDRGKFANRARLKSHDGDPIRAEATALVRAFLAACRATGEGRKEGENGE